MGKTSINQYTPTYANNELSVGLLVRLKTDHEEHWGRR